MNIKRQISLHIPPQMWQQFRHAMLESRTNNEEVIGFFFCKRHQVSKYQVRYLPKFWVVPSPDCYEYQSLTGLVLKQAFHLYLLETYLKKEKLDVVHIHTHPVQESPNFSSIDDRYESEYSQFLGKNFQKKTHLISGVFDHSLQDGMFRLWDKKGKSPQSIDFYTSWFALPQNEMVLEHDNLMFSRQAIFGDMVQENLGELKVALIGCGGIGAIFAELLGRLGVKNWLLIDRDRVETVNLNRMPGATEKMVSEQWYKVDYVKSLIKNIYPKGCNVQRKVTNIEDESIKKEIAKADLIVVATDNHYSRQVAQELALEYTRPLVCLGTHIEMKSDHKPRMYARVTVPPLGGDWCLMCGNIINLQRAAMELAPQEIHLMASEAGYLPGIQNPAVFWLNSLCASTAVGVIHGILSGFLEVDGGLDWIFDFASSQWLKTNPEHLVTPDCYFCA